MLDTMPIHFLGREEYVYQAYVSAYFTAAGDASTALDRMNTSHWEVGVEQWRDRSHGLDSAEDGSRHWGYS